MSIIAEDEAKGSREVDCGNYVMVESAHAGSADRCELEDIHDPKIRRAYIRAHIRAYAEPKMATFERWLVPWAEGKHGPYGQTRRLTELVLAFVDGLLCTQYQWPELWLEPEPEDIDEPATFTIARNALRQINGQDVSDTLGTTDEIVDIEAEIYALSGSWPICEDDDEVWEVYFSVQKCVAAYAKVQKPGQ